MAVDNEKNICPFDFSEALEFDPELADLMDRDSPAYIRLPYGDAGAWLVTGFDAVKQVTTDHRLSRAAIIGHDYPRLTPEPIVSPESVNVMDPPHSSRVRQLASQAFTQQQVEGMRSRITWLADVLLDKMEEDGRPADLVQYLSDPLPQHTILDLLGIERDEWPQMQESVRRLLVVDPDNKEAAASAKADLTSYFAKLVEQRRKSPGKDIISTMAAARDGKDQLDDRELAVMALTLTLSGQDTATCQISDIAYLLLTRPELMEHLRRRPETLTDVLQEMLRHIPFRKGVGIPRLALEDVELDGARIRAGDFVHVSYLAANRDPKRFPDPHVLDPDRPYQPHMTFGWGGHRCIAVPLAMAELEVAIGRLLQRFPGLRLAVPPEEVRWDTETIRRFPMELPVTW
ncbi:cytochrome P450 [Streptomyces sp. NBC_01340]|uniref:cytochrome P450 n=1 Tax=unclassified Streptomyces TaxID=2593676 RepID=UPI002255A9FC|nr:MULTISPECIES: cytochrome P450 [unclassified Streptomyces]MCX4457125.1 cytochrome P450 [Streptomyces sp. NBC_01719]MCX4496484.1 cytochrome P450 [Streptomyces sp. NBC_01728]MCX4588931.1 cytochrome P450 [Streptomyces sp. NBC_01549]WSI41388.1 cytochrome P450 [Streptomyces sp. NBC_01340]